ncbi:AraC family transcriptional regulator [Devosia geojensis]|uniref:AraC family transcriptional regulator n=1 Tax=Devosia geojensis TaxID=443610 RepID=A0A0F5FTM6_9HYPH|nr:GlxA family transcriptional regulator [Devosia geojensis]KKB12221.1 AraC family transcriptional regulator [Devosia geojensis]
MLQHVVIAVYPDFELLDAAGPASVFASANHALAEDGEPHRYAVHLVSPTGGAVPSSSGVVVETKALGQVPRQLDTILVAGAEAGAITAAARTPELGRWLSRSASSVRRLGSVCAGTFVLAAAGLVDGKRVATHWSACEPLARLYPSLTVDADALYVVEGNVWTSAGVTTGIDMALAMVNEDLGGMIASRVAERLVLYARRPGYQSQFSPLLRAQAKADGPFADLLVWAQANLDTALDVPSLAARVSLSERTFHRRFVAAMGETPARYIETVRLDAARILLSQDLPLKEIARRVGLAPTARFTQVFQRRFGVTPRLFRETHGSR